MEKITQRLIFPELFAKPIHYQFDEPHSSSDGGALLLKAADQKLQLSSALAACLIDDRQAAKVKHSLSDLLRQRIYGLASGYADANDAARLAHDPMFKLLLDRSPVAGQELSSQPTLSRFENSIGPRDNYRLGLALLGFLSFNDEPEQYLVTALLRPGNASEKHGVVVGLLQRLVGLVRAAFPQALIKLRLDGGFTGPLMLAYLDSVPRLLYVCGMPKNAVLERHAEPLLAAARKLSQLTNQSAQVFGECRYQARSWEQQRRVIIKAEIVFNQRGEPKDNPRFVVTNQRQSPKFIYKKAYCSRGEIENRIK